MKQEKIFYENRITETCPSSLAHTHKVGENINYTIILYMKKIIIFHRLNHLKHQKNVKII